MEKFLNEIELRWGAYPRRIVQSELKSKGYIPRRFRRRNVLKSTVVVDNGDGTLSFKEEFLNDIANVAKTLGVKIDII